MFLSLEPEKPESSDQNTLPTLEFMQILTQKKITPFFQPIVSLLDGNILGYEALSRGPVGCRGEYPDVLFETARKCQRLWELEALCCAKAIEKFHLSFQDHTLIFLNIDPSLIQEGRLDDLFNPQQLAQWGLSTEKIIFEITEKASIRDLEGFQASLDHYKRQGYRIALDDMGSGYSGLKRLTLITPNFVKVDMDLIRNIYRNYFKQTLLQSLQELAQKNNMKIIAEGIETEEELRALIKLGIPYGQGYFLQRPQPQFVQLEPTLIALIREQNNKKQRTAVYYTLSMPIGEIAQPMAGVSSNTSGYHLADYFHEHTTCRGVPVVDQDKPVGLIMKDKFFSNLATQYGLAVYMNRPIALIMDRQPLIVDYEMSLEQVSQIAVNRAENQLYDYILVTRQQRYCGIITVKDLLAKTTQLEVNRAKHANPLTGLPGNIMIEQVLQDVLDHKGFFSVFYFDLDNFKAYNDVYGFEQGDVILRKTAQIIQAQLDPFFRQAFIGHIGGDDFIAVLRELPLEQVKDLCQAILHSFDQAAHEWYRPEDLSKGYITAKNRHGIEEKFPMITLSVAVVTNTERNYASPQDLAAIAGVVKKKCKLSWTSCYSVDGQGVCKSLLYE